MHKCVFSTHLACKATPSAGWYRLGYSAGICISMHCSLAAAMTHAWQSSLQVWTRKTTVMTWMLMVTTTSVMMQVLQHMKTHAGLGSSSCIIFAVHYALTASQCDYEARHCFVVMAKFGGKSQGLSCHSALYPSALTDHFLTM